MPERWKNRFEKMVHSLKHRERNSAAKKCENTRTLSAQRGGSKDSLCSSSKSNKNRQVGQSIPALSSPLTHTGPTWTRQQETDIPREHSYLHRKGTAATWLTSSSPEEQGLAYPEGRQPT